MFATLSNKFSNIISSLNGRAIISEEDLNSTFRDIRIALLEADVALPVVKEFIKNIKEKIIGQNILKNIKPDQMIIKLVNDQLVEVLGSSKTEINIDVKSPAVILFCGLQGSGKTTSAAKIAKILKNKKKKKILMVSADIYRPAAQEQLEILSKQIQVDFIKNNSLKDIKKIITNATNKAKSEFYDVLIIDTAGRQVIDQAMMNELKIITDLSSPSEKLLVADSLTGQDAANIAIKFNESIDITGIMLTRIDGDGKGGAALSIKSTTGSPIKYLGTGEKIDQIEEFYPERIANRILGMGDIITLVEKASENIQKDELEKLADNFKKGKFDFSDFAKQLKQMKKMGGVDGILSMLPGISKAQKMMAANNINDDLIIKQLAIINSMTKKEKTNPDLIKASRKKRIANGSGTKIQEINKLLKQFMQSKKIMKKMNNMNTNNMSSNLIDKLRGNMPTNFK